VGQGDSSLVCFGSDDVMLIDAGDNWNTASINMELNERGITQIDVLIATHPHADHIGGMQDIIENYDIGCIYMPNMQSDSKTYQKLMDTIEDRDIEIITAYAGESFDLGPANCTIVSPDKNADYDANNESVMLFVDYMDTEFLFTGDAEKWAEDQVLSAGYDIDADVLKVGHHGSSTSTSVDFLKAVSPGYAVISCGKDNDYGHPHSKTIDRLGTFDVGILRTDFKGDVLFLSDGHTLKTILGD
jgi:competence protein ComEC